MLATLRIVMLMASVANNFYDTRMVSGQVLSNKSSNGHLLIHSYILRIRGTKSCG